MRYWIALAISLLWLTIMSADDDVGPGIIWLPPIILLIIVRLCDYGFPPIKRKDEEL